MYKKCFFMIVGLLVASLAWAAQTQLLDKVVAVVNNDVITASQLQQFTQAFAAQYKAANQPLPPAARLRHDALQALIDHRLQLQIARRNHVKVTDDQLNKAIAGIAKRNHLSVDELKQQLAKQKLSYADYRRQLTEQILVTEVQQNALRGRIKAISDADVKHYLQANASVASAQYTLIDYLIPVAQTASASEWQQAASLAAALLNQLNQQASTKKLTKTFPSLQVNDLGARAASDLPDAFLPSLKSLAVKHYSRPIKAANGYHVLYLAKKTTPTTEMTAQQAREQLFQQRYQQALKTWLAQLRKQSYIKIMH